MRLFFTHLKAFFSCHSAERLLIIPPFLAIGIVTSLISETLLWATWIAIFLSLYLYKKLESIFFIWMPIALITGLLLGFSLKKQYDSVNTINQIYHTVTVSGKIMRIIDNAHTPRLILKITPPNTKLPKQIRLNISAKEYAYLKPYDTISAIAFLAPPSKPAFKNGYNFSFYAKLNNFGAIGRIKQVITHTPYQQFSFKRNIHNLRIHIAHTIKKILPIHKAAPIIAMVTGARFHLPKAISDTWKQSGIYHLLSISGLHMTIIAGLCFVTIRRFLLLFPYLAHGAHVKKITACCVIPISYLYVLLSGGAVPVMRAYIMVCVGLLAVLYNQNIITIRSACVAFCIILLINPADIFNIGFALSFAAVLGIIIMIRVSEYFRKNTQTSKIMSFCMINFGAGYAGLPLIIYTFSTQTTYGLITNAFAVPLASIILMPLIMISIIAMIFNWHTYPLIVTGICIEWLNSLSDFISHLPFAIMYHQPPWLIFVVIFYIGLYCLAIFTPTTLKIAITCMTLSVIGYGLTPKIDFLKIVKSKIIFYTNTDNKLIRLVRYDRKKYNTYLQEQVLLHFGLKPTHQFYHDVCNKNKSYTTISGKKFKCQF